MSKEPIRIDLLIIKEENADKVMKNEIGHIMRKYNVEEIKKGSFYYGKEIKSAHCR